MPDALDFRPALERPDLLADRVRDRLAAHADQRWALDVHVAEIDPDHAGGVDLCAHYGLDPGGAGNCLVVEARRAGSRTFAACVIEPGRRASLNGALRSHLGARRVSLAPEEDATRLSGMERGSITPVGLPLDWPVLVTLDLLEAPSIVVGTGLLRSKLRMPGRAFVALTGAVGLDGLAH